MSNLRWILLFAGFAILLLLYFSGRPKKNRTNDEYGPTGKDREGVRGRTDASIDRTGAQLTHETAVARHRQHNAAAPPPLRRAERGGPSLDHTQNHLHQDPLMGTHDGSSQHSGSQRDEGFSASDAFGSLDPDDLVRPASNPDDFKPRPGNLSAEKNGPPMSATALPAGGSSIAEKIEAFSAKLTPKRKSRVASSVPADTAPTTGHDIKVVVLHVVEPNGQLIDGSLLLEVFEQRGYHFGDMNIFHSMHQGNTVFSIAKIVEPGSFDINNVDSFVTPGLVLILQLPGPVSGDVAFEVLISEAHELATALGCRVLDSDRSTLSKQTVQHLRESIYEYMHRQKYFGKVSS